VCGPRTVHACAATLLRAGRTVQCLRPDVAGLPDRRCSHALMTGQLDTSQFGLPPGGFGVADFLRSIQAAADEKRRQPEAREGQGGGGDAAQQ
jgi:hypothetical protein